MIFFFIDVYYVYSIEWKSFWLLQTKWDPKKLMVWEIVEWFRLSFTQEIKNKKLKWTSKCFSFPGNRELLRFQISQMKIEDFYVHIYKIIVRSWLSWNFFFYLNFLSKNCFTIFESLKQIKVYKKKFVLMDF